MPGKSLDPGSREQGVFRKWKTKGDAVVRVSRFEEEAIEIGNS